MSHSVRKLLLVLLVALCECLLWKPFLPTVLLSGGISFAETITASTCRKCPYAIPKKANFSFLSQTVPGNWQNYKEANEINSRDLVQCFRAGGYGKTFPRLKLVTRGSCGQRSNVPVVSESFATYSQSNFAKPLCHATLPLRVIASVVLQGLRGCHTCISFIRKAFLNFVDAFVVLKRLSCGEIPYLLMGSICVVITAICESTMPIYFTAALQTALSKPMSSASVAILSWATISFTQAIFGGLRTYLFSVAGARGLARLRSSIFDALLHRNISFHDASEKQSLVRRLGANTEELADVIPVFLNPLLRELLVVLLGFRYLFSLNVRLASLILAVVSSSSILNVLNARIKKGIASEILALKAKSTQIASEGLSLISVVRAHNMENMEWKKYKDSLQEVQLKQRWDGMVSGAFTAFNRITSVLTPVLTLVYGKYLLQNGLIKPSSLTASFFYLRIVQNSANFWSYWINIQEALAEGSEVLSLLDENAHSPSGILPSKSSNTPAEPQSQHFVTDLSQTTHSLNSMRNEERNFSSENEPPSSIDSTSSERQLSDYLNSDKNLTTISENRAPMFPSSLSVDVRQRGSMPGSSPLLSFKNVSFSYPSNPSAMILNNISLDVYPGQHIAVVGPSGSGKTTLLRLALQFYEPESGDILMGNLNIKEYKRADLLSQISWVSQVTDLLPTSIRENIAYALPENSFTEKDIIEAATQANCHEFISRLPQGYDTHVGEHGNLLSGGQRQRIYIARALLRKPRVLLLDEATSALEPESEKYISEALRKVTENSSVLVVAHNMDTIKNSDVIYVLKDGKVVEVGYHDELKLRSGGPYQDLLKRQTQFVN
ncbi:putative ABC transporter B family member 2 [Cardiosporidium cionae]|uniref:ABC transporter B family member 2 n=1 Tax=Cardiosporidium cionae TaxID=476202 RepID=A0ABQ7JBW3_9APIC|nr:putative ABC transporter B family member 2 [Cardiosporidium cionae]|eukprot:KAF8821495.1 putative ABC transporter B family member 2 [Cardiosporidium cionae]